MMPGYEIKENNEMFFFYQIRKYEEKGKAERLTCAVVGLLLCAGGWGVE